MAKPLLRSKRDLRNEIEALRASRWEMRAALTEIAYWNTADPREIAGRGLKAAENAYTRVVVGYRG